MKNKTRIPGSINDDVQASGILLSHMIVSISKKRLFLPLANREI